MKRLQKSAPTCPPPLGREWFACSCPLRTTMTRRVVFELKKCIKKRDGPELDTL